MSILTTHQKQIDFVDKVDFGIVSDDIPNQKTKTSYPFDHAGVSVGVKVMLGK